MTDLVFPRLSERDPDAEGIVASWFVDEGAVVSAGQLVGEVMVEKVSSEVHAPDAGTIHLAVAEEEVVRQGTVIATVTAS